MYFLGIDHVGVTVASLERSLAFNRDVLGLPVIERSEDEAVGDIVLIKGARIRTADLDADQGLILELVEYVARGGEWKPHDANSAGCLHLALRVSDIQAVLQRLRDSGFSVDRTPTLISGESSWSGSTVVYLRDPDGAIVELVQRPIGTGGAQGRVVAR